MIVTKFGGTSLADATQFKKVKNIITSNPERKVVVVSAPGKRDSSDYKITDLLYLTYSHIKYKVDYRPLFAQVRTRYEEIAKELNLNIDLASEFKNLEEKIDDGIKEEELVSRGEYFSAKQMSAYLGFAFVDSKDLIAFTYDGKLDTQKTLNQIKKAYEKYGPMVVPGFYGSYPNGEICLFSRGGSDVTASYVAKAIQAQLYENFTDVSGFYMADPKIIHNPRKINYVSYDELRELSYSGASVLHEETIIPLLDENIPIEILNTNAPEEKGTLIKRQVDDKEYLLTGITGKKNFVAITVIKTRSSSKTQVMLETLKILNKYRLNIEHTPTSIDSFSLIISKEKIGNRIYDVIGEIKALDNVNDVLVDEDIALIAVVGRNMIATSGISGRILSVFGEESINIKLLAQGNEELNITIGISNADFNKSILKLYEKFAFEKVNG